MTAYSSSYDRERARFKAECAAENKRCIHCRGSIDYASVYDPASYNPRLFSLEHLDPTSDGGSVMRRDRWRPSCIRCNASRGNSSRGMFPTSRSW